MITSINQALLGIPSIQQGGKNHVKVEVSNDKTIMKFLPAGYSKNQRPGIHNDIYKAAQTLTTSDEEAPFGTELGRVRLVPEPTNKFDPNAIRIHLDIKTGPLSHLNLTENTDLGYVPAAINQNLLKDLDKVSRAYIYKVKDFGKYKVAKIAIEFSLDSGFNISKYFSSMDRFNSLMEE